MVYGVCVVVSSRSSSVCIAQPPDSINPPARTPDTALCLLQSLAHAALKGFGILEMKGEMKTSSQGRDSVHIVCYLLPMSLVTKQNFIVCTMINVTD